LFTSKDSDKHWNKFGEVDPYFGVISNEIFHFDKLDDSTCEKFYASGTIQIDAILNSIRDHLDSDFHPVRALEFGCGVGRLVVPLASHVKSVVGVDISHSMLERARKYCVENGVKNVEFVKSDDILSNVNGTFDLILSYIVFQHIEVTRGMKILSHLLDRLADKGIAVLHFTYGSSGRSSKAVHRMFKYVPLFGNFYNLSRGRGFFYPQMQTNYYDLDDIITLIHNAGCSHFYMLFTKHNRNLGVIIFAQKKQSMLVNPQF